MAKRKSNTLKPVRISRKIAKPKSSGRTHTGSRKKNTQPKEKEALGHRPLWKGYISFGLVNIPVILLTAEKTHQEVHFKLLDKENLANIKYVRINAQTGEEVSWENIVKGYEYTPGNYAILTEDDLASVAIENMRTIEIEDFVDKEQLTSLFFEKPYFLLPNKGGEKGYVLLRETLINTNKVGIARIMIRSHQYLAAILATESALIVNTIRYPDELKKITEIDVPSQSVKHYQISKKEFEIAEQLVNTMSVKWDPDRYPNIFREALLKLVEEKVKSGKKGSIKHVKGPKVKQTNVIDFMTLLKKSVTQKQKLHTNPKHTNKRSKD